MRRSNRNQSRPSTGTYTSPSSAACSDHDDKEGLDSIVWSPVSTSAEISRRSSFVLDADQDQPDEQNTIVPNAQFFAFFLLIVLLISSPLIKIVSVSLFVILLALQDA